MLSSYDKGYFPEKIILLNWHKLLMKGIKNELQNIIFGDGSVGTTSQIKKVQSFLRANEKTSIGSKKQKYLKSEKALYLIEFAIKEDLFYKHFNQGNTSS